MTHIKNAILYDYPLLVPMLKNNLELSQLKLLETMILHNFSYKKS